MRSPRRDVGTLARTASRSEAWVATRMGPGAPNASGPSSRVTNVTDDPAVVAMRPNAEPTRPLPTTVNEGGGRGGRLGVVGSRRGGGSRRRRRATRWRRAGGERRRTRRRCHLRRARDTTPRGDEPATFALREGRRARRALLAASTLEAGVCPRSTRRRPRRQTIARAGRRRVEHPSCQAHNRAQSLNKQSEDLNGANFRGCFSAQRAISTAAPEGVWGRTPNEGSAIGQKRGARTRVRRQTR